MALDLRPALHASAPDSIDDLREMLGSLEAQLVSLYEERESPVVQTAPTDEALYALYEDKQRLGARTVADLRASVESLSEQLAEFYHGREHPDHSGDATQDMLASLTDQLHALYEEREHAAYAGTLGADDRASLLSSLQSFEAQLHALYEERALAPVSHAGALDMVTSLEAQVAALLDERNELADRLSLASLDVLSAKKRARDLINAVIDQSLA